MNRKIHEEELPWLWAYNEQLFLYYRHDAYWIELAGKKWAGSEGVIEFGRFLTDYGLRRGKVGRFLKTPENRKYVIDLCHRIFPEPLRKNDFENAQKRWNKVATILQGKMKSKPASLALKIFWFYHPDRLPMYDTSACRGLSRELKRKINPNNFLTDFEEFYNNNQSNIERAEKWFSERYISRPRVADKYLWLCGSDWRTRSDYLRWTVQNSPFLRK
jgi:hypothetical protein